MALILVIDEKIKRVMNKLLTAFLFIITFSFILTSCGRYTSKYAYRWGEDGLIYNSDNGNLYTGTVLDTADVIIEFQVVNGKKNGTFTTYYLDGQVEKSGHIINNDNFGLWKYYYPDGQIESEGRYENNIPEGEWISYYPNGIKKCEGIYIHGKQEDTWRYYDLNGNTTNIILFQDGEFVERLQIFS
jgi:antitoxin component YwqK of YwqJK toxin-antitoxin module